MKKTILAIGLVSIVIPALATIEDDLAAKLPEIFSKSAAHYKALDAAATPLMKDEKGALRTPHGFKRAKGELDMRSILWWTAGHFPGSLWYLYEATGENFFKDRATVWTELLAPNSKAATNHDVGFIMFCSYGNARRLLKTDKYDALLIETANSLCERYNEKLGLIRSWGNKDDEDKFLVIPDNLMNLELLEFAAAKDKKFDQVARSHADVTMKNHFRPDGGCYHVLNYDQRPQSLGQIQEIRRGQGLCVGTAWSRGQSWGIYGYTMMYRTSGYVRYLDFAKKLADYAMNHPNMPEDGIPYWDYGARGEERDSSAGSIMASALLELSQYVGAADRDRYRSFAVKQLLALASPEYFSEGNEIGHFLLKHGTGHKPGNSEIDTPLDYGDYYFLEALLRFRKLKAREQSDEKRIAAKGFSASLEPQIAAKYKILTSDRWGGGHRMIFDFDGRKAWLVEPLDGVKVESDRPWIWTIQWMGAYLRRTGADKMVQQGYCHVHLEAHDLRGNEEGLAAFAKYQDYLVNELNFAPKANLIGMSWGGFYSIRYANRYPDRVRRIYLDAPLMNFDIFETTEKNRIGVWTKVSPADGKWTTDPRMPVNMADSIAKAKIPIFLLYGGEDQTVRPNLNSEIFIPRFQKAGGDLKFQKRTLYGHHPHGVELDEVSRIINFFK